MASKHGWAKMRTHNKGEAVMGRWRSVVALGVGVVLLAAGGWAIAEVKVDAGLQAYKATAGVSGNISSVGSDTLNNLMTLWAESFNKFYPNAKIQIEGKGSSTAPPALIAGTAQRADVTLDEGDRGRQVREEVRLQADADPDVGGRARRLREQGQPGQVHDPGPAGRGLLEFAPPGRQGRRHDVGPARPHGRLGLEADQPLRPQLGLRHLRLLQGARAQE